MSTLAEIEKAAEALPALDLSPPLRWALGASVLLILFFGLTPGLLVDISQVAVAALKL